MRGLLLCWCAFALPLSAQTLVIQHATVITMTSAKPLKDYTVVVEGNRITLLQKGSLKIKPSVSRETLAPQIIDAKGKFLIPGLWDMHMHLGLPEAFFPLLLAHGITGVREMYSGIPPQTIAQWRTRPEVPRIVASGFLDGPLMLEPGQMPPPGAFAVATADQARYAVQVLKLSGYDFIKVYSDLPRDAYFAIAQEARAIGIPFAGHVPETVSPLEASEAGQRSEEHLMNILLACSTNEAALRAERVRVMNSTELSGEARLRLLGFPKLEGLADTYDETKAATLFQTFVRNGTWQVPTLALLHGFAYGDEFVADPLMQKMPEGWRKTAHPRDKPYMKDLTPDQFDDLVKSIRALLERHKKLVGDMHRAGVQFLAGTDTSLNNPVIPGKGLHQELQLLVESGLTPREALETATVNPARYFGVLNQMGTIEAGKFADMVLLDADPLKDIRNTLKVRGVVMRGRYFGRAEIDGMVEKVGELVTAP